ncbi:MAG: exodeoxyribonuclease V subunit alpha [Myxococcales bacterium]|jgi:exodeoxyribonuclease V alpha subunit
MSGQGRLTPLGTARERFLRASDRACGPQSAEPALPPELARAAEGFELDDAVLYQAWELTRCAPGLDTRGQRALLFLSVAALVNLKRGSTRLPLGGEGLEDLLPKLDAAPEDRQAVRELLEQALAGSGPAAALVGGPGDYKPFVVEGGSLYLQRMRHFEDRLVASLQARMAASAAGAEEARIREALDEVMRAAPVVNGKPVALSDEQQEAVLTALREPLAVVSGGPGTGKTSIVVSILRTLARLGVPMEKVALAAPTGKAANRMQEAIRKYLAGLGEEVAAADAQLVRAPPEARTLHRLLGYLPSADRFRHHANNPLSEEVVIVDEGSMVDLFLMCQLVRAVRPEARLVLLGDAEQLPSVDAGAVLRDLLPSGEPDARRRCAVRLTKSYRMDPSDPSGRAVLTVAHAINAGEVGRAMEGMAPRVKPVELEYEKVELLVATGAQQREAFLADWYRRRVRALEELPELVRREFAYRADGESLSFSPADEEALWRLFRHLESARLLCVTRGQARPTGIAACNAWLHRAFAEDPEVGVSVPLATASFLPGEPVLMQRNDYQRGLFNGDQGVVLRVSLPGESSHHFRAVFPTRDGFRPFSLEGLRPMLQHAFAMTVHKSQGSEFDHVALMLPEDEMPLLTREVLYTGATRARRSVVFVGALKILRVAIGNRMTRFSGIGERLAGG